MITKQRKMYRLMMFILMNLLLVSLLGIINIEQINGSGAQIMNQVGLQRTRAQGLAKDALIIVDGTGGPNPGFNLTQAASELQTILPNWNATQIGLQFGSSSLGLPNPPPADIVLAVTQSQIDYGAMYTALQHIAANPTDHTATAHLQLQIALDHLQGYYLAMGGINTLWRIHINDAFVRFYWIETCMSIGIIVLALILYVSSFYWFKKEPVAEEDKKVEAVPLVADNQS